MHIANNDLGTTNYPCVPGHELAGIVTKVGSKVEKVRVGDHVGVGCIVDACLKCQSCKDGEENYCENGHTMTYDTKITHGHLKTNSGYTFGGYSQKMTIMEDFIIKVYVLKLHCNMVQFRDHFTPCLQIPTGYPLEAAGPILCAGVTMFSPLKHWKADKGGKRVGVIGVGGLGQVIEVQL